MVEALVTFGVIANFGQVFDLCTKIVHNLAQFTVNAADSYESINELLATIGLMRDTVIGVQDVIEGRKSLGKPRQPSEERLCKRICYLIRSSQSVLQRLWGIVPKLPLMGQDPGLLGLIRDTVICSRATLLKSLQEPAVVDAITKVNIITQALQISLSLLNIDRQQDLHDQVMGEIRALSERIHTITITNSSDIQFTNPGWGASSQPSPHRPTSPQSPTSDTRSRQQQPASLLSLTPSTSRGPSVMYEAVRREFLAWKDSANDVATQYMVDASRPSSPKTDGIFELDGSDYFGRRHTVARHTIESNHNNVGHRRQSEIGQEDTTASYGHYLPGFEEHRYGHFQSLMDQARRNGRFEEAANHQREVIGAKERMCRGRGQSISATECASMRETLADLLLEVGTLDALEEACWIIEKLASWNQPSTAADSQDMLRSATLFRKLGIIYLKGQQLHNAEVYLFRGAMTHIQVAMQNSRDESTRADLWETTSQMELLLKRMGKYHELDAFRGYMHKNGLSCSPLDQGPTQGEGNAASPTSFISHGLSASDAAPSSPQINAWCQARGFRGVNTPGFTYSTCDANLSGTSPLHLAAEQADTSILQGMVNYVYDFEVRRAHDQATPLLVAASTRRHSAVKLLIQSGARVDVADKDGLTALHRCQSNARGIKVAKLLLMTYYGAADSPPLPPSPLHSIGVTVNFNNPGLASLPQLDLQPSANTLSSRPAASFIDRCDKHGQTALYLACSRGNDAMLQVLLSWGADPNIADYYGRAPLHLACERCDIGIIRTLLSPLPVEAPNADTPAAPKRVEPNLPGPERRTPLIATILSKPRPNLKKLDILRLLRDHGADPMLPDEHDRDAYFYASGSTLKREFLSLFPRTQ